jgi:hypothetical protein
MIFHIFYETVPTTMIKVPASPHIRGYQDQPSIKTFSVTSQKKQTDQTVSAAPQDVFFGGSQGDPSFRDTIRALEQAFGNFTTISLSSSPRRQPEHPKNAINVELEASTNVHRDRKIIINRQEFTARLLQEPQGLPHIELRPKTNSDRIITIELLADRESLQYTDMSGQGTTINKIPPSLQRVFDIIRREEKHTQFWREHFDEVIQERLAILNNLLDAGVTPTRISTESGRLSFDLGDLRCSISPSDISFYDAPIGCDVNKKDEDKLPNTHIIWFGEWINIDGLNSEFGYNSTHYGIDDMGSPETIYDEEPNAETLRLLNQTFRRLQSAVTTAQAARA